VVHYQFICYALSLIIFCFSWGDPGGAGHSGLKISVKVLSLSFQAGLAGGCAAFIISFIPLITFFFPSSFYMQQLVKN
jgi:hypothetical protein